MDLIRFKRTERETMPGFCLLKKKIPAGEKEKKGKRFSTPAERRTPTVRL
jgi:hypothetical protein